MNVLLQDFVEPKVLGDSLHLHPVWEVDCCDCLLGCMGVAPGSNWNRVCSATYRLREDSHAQCRFAVHEGDDAMEP